MVWVTGENLNKAGQGVGVQARNDQTSTMKGCKERGVQINGGARDRDSKNKSGMRTI